MTYIVNYNKDQDDLFQYTGTFSVWPTYSGESAFRENPNLPLKNQIAFYDGIGVTYDIDLSGVQGMGIFRQPGVFFSCSTGCDVGNCICTNTIPFPYCGNLWDYAAMRHVGVMGDVVQEACKPFIEFPFNPVVDRTKYLPVGLIDAREGIVDENDNINPINGKYWNDINLWRTNVFQGAVLIDSEDNDSETYAVHMGHPVTTSPCTYPIQLSFFDRSTNTVHSRYFRCPCAEWGLPQFFFPNEGLSCKDCCDYPYTWFTSQSSGGYDEPNRESQDGNRLFVMMKINPVTNLPQDPLPNTIKRYKVLIGSVRDNWPIFGIDPQARFIRAETRNYPVVVRGRDTNKYGNFAIRNYFQLFDKSIMFEGGQGDDGAYPTFTIDENGETILVAFQTSDGYDTRLDDNVNLLYNQPITQNVPTPCTPDTIFIKDNDKLKFNTYCAPALFHPELVIPNYPTNDIELKMNISPRGGTVLFPYRLRRINELLEQLGKPKIKSYGFPEKTPPQETYFPDNISELDKRYPLFNSPYFSRESKNSFFTNTNLISFNEKHMLQASELNELQEKFYKKESMFFEYISKKFKKQNFYKTNDIFGFSEFISDKIDTSQYWNIFEEQLKPSDTYVLTGYPWICSKAIPFEENVITLEDIKQDLKTNLKLSPCKLMLNSVFYQSSVLETDGYSPDIQKKYNNIDYIKIENDIKDEIDLSNILESNELNGEVINAFILKIDINNIITCNDYLELKDNSSSDNQFSPCGADRNYIPNSQDSNNSNIEIIQKTIKQKSGIWQEIDKFYYNSFSFFNTTPFNQTAWPGYMLYLLAFAKKENGVITFYYANGLPIENM